MTLVKFKVENCVGRSALMAYHSNKMAKRAKIMRDFLLLSCDKLKKLRHHDKGLQVITRF